MDELDAARECVMAVGVRRTTFSDVAFRAGISRMTLYRRYPELGSVLSALIARDLGAIIVATEAEVRDLPAAQQRLVEALVRGAQAMTRSPLVLRILEVDPELLMHGSRGGREENQVTVGCAVRHRAPIAYPTTLLRICIGPSCMRRSVDGSFGLRADPSGSRSATGAGV